MTRFTPDSGTLRDYFVRVLCQLIISGNIRGSNTLNERMITRMIPLTMNRSFTLASPDHVSR